MSGMERWNLGRLGKDLYWDGRNLVELAARYGTPLFVVSRKRLERSCAEMKAAFHAEGLEADIFFSFKTNPLPRALQVLTAAGVGAEVISEFEMWLTGKLGLGGDRILVNGTLKPKALLSRAVECGARLINVETIAELRSLMDVAEKLGKKANIGLRINPGLRKRRLQFTTTTGSSSSPIGFRRSSEEWSGALKFLRAHQDLFAFRGLHFHIGTGISSAAPYQEALANSLGFMDSLLENGFCPEILDIGGGFNISTLKEINAWEAVRLFLWNRPQEPPATKNRPNLLREVARACAGQLQEYAQSRGIPLPKIFVEPGRALSGPSQVLLLTVNSVRQRNKGPNSVFCDGGAMSLSQLLISEYHEIFVANKPDQRQLAKYNIFGNLPTPLDLVSFQRRLPSLSPGDILAVMDTGAYFTSLGNNFAGPRPAVVMLENGAPLLIRRRETFEDLIARDTPF